MLSGEIFLRLHFDQPALGALELECEFRAPIQFGHGAFGGDDEFDGPVVELIDQRDKSACLVLGFHAECRHGADEDGVIAAGNFDVIGLSAWTVAQFLEREPDDIVGLAARMQAPVIERQGGVRLAGFAGDGFEQALQTGIGVWAARVEPGRGLFQQAQSIVGGAVDVHDLGMFLQQLDGRKESRSLQAFLVEIVGRDVRSGNERDAAGEQAAKQRSEQHGVGNIGDEELIETDEARFARDLLGDEFQRVGVIGMFLQLIVDVLHETVEVTALAVLERQAVVEQIHQPGLAATDATPDVQALMKLLLLAREQALEQTPFRLGSEQALAQIIQVSDHAFLDRIALIAEAGAFAVVEVGDGGGRRGMVGHGSELGLAWVRLWVDLNRVSVGLAFGASRLPLSRGAQPSAELGVRWVFVKLAQAFSAAAWRL